MAEGQGFIDETIDTPENSTDTSVAVADGAEGQDNYGSLQDRMAGDVEDTPWYSPSEGKVVDTNGRVLVDENGQPYKSMDAYAASQAATSTAKPKTGQVETKQPPAPMSRSFDAIVSEGQDITPEKLFELAKAGGEHLYSDELVPKIEASAQGAVQQEQTKDPVEVVNQERQELNARLVQPISKIRDLLLQNGANADWVTENIGPILKEQMDLIESRYQVQYQKALEAKLSGPVTEKLSKLDSDRLKTAAMANIEKIARTYYPKDGKDGFFALINGHNETDATGKQSFVRGPSAKVMDLIAAVANNGKTFRTAEERNSAYSDMFHRIAADGPMSEALIDIAHNYWLGKKAAQLQKMSYEKGKQSAAASQQRVQRTIKTKPASYTQPSTEDEEKGMPSMLKNVLRGMR
jgi:hypothetical protein